jgi:MFS family permease
MNLELGFNVGDRYSVALLVFFITYFIFEIPSNVILRKVGAANWLAFLCMSWGIVVFGAGFAKKWEDIVVCRLLLGLFEAGFFPGCKLSHKHVGLRFEADGEPGVFLISCWYSRFEVQKRLAAFYSINIVANGFGSILAYGCMQLSGKNGWLGWRWYVLLTPSPCPSSAAHLRSISLTPDFYVGSSLSTAQ